jgi:hypothetical protein
MASNRKKSKKREPEVRPGYIRKLKRIRKEKAIHIGTVVDFRKRYG